jgi:predicted nucleotidyltransferase
MKYIHPLKQLDLYYILEAWKDDDNINRVVVFGSSVSDRCHSGSDIDLYLELKDNEKPPKLPYDKIISDVDMIINVKQTDSIWKAIDRDGIVVRGV